MLYTLNFAYPSTRINRIFYNQRYTVYQKAFIFQVFNFTRDSSLNKVALLNFTKACQLNFSAAVINFDLFTGNRAFILLSSIFKNLLAIKLQTVCTAILGWVKNVPPIYNVEKIQEYIRKKALSIYQLS